MIPAVFPQRKNRGGPPRSTYLPGPGAANQAPLFKPLSAACRIGQTGASHVFLVLPVHPSWLVPGWIIHYREPRSQMTLIPIADADLQVPKTLRHPVLDPTAPQVSLLPPLRPPYDRRRRRRRRRQRADCIRGPDRLMSSLLHPIVRDRTTFSTIGTTTTSLLLLLPPPPPLLQISLPLHSE